MSQPQKSLEDIILEIYSDLTSPASFGSIKSVQQELANRGVKADQEQVRSVLSKLSNAYATHAQKVRRFKRSHLKVSYIDQEWFLDSAYMLSWAGYNNQIKYVTLVTDALSFFVWIIPLRRLTSESLAAALEHLFTTTGRIPNT